MVESVITPFIPPKTVNTAVMAIRPIAPYQKGISNKYTKYSHLIGGIIMLLLGILMALKPEWLMFNF